MADYKQEVVAGTTWHRFPKATFPAIDPETGLPVGRDITHGEVYALLNSLYMHLATQRDLAVRTQTEEA